MVDTARTATHVEALARFGHAIAEPKRAQILLALNESPAYPADLAEALGVTKQIMSNHLACLRGCGLVEAVPQGRRNLYRLTDVNVAEALKHLMRVVLFIDPDCCDAEGCTCA